MANAHHQATECDKRCRCETKLFGTEQTSNGYVAAGFELAISL